MLSLLIQGDETAFRALFKEFYTPLFYYCRNIVHDEEEAKDIVLSTFYKCWERKAQFQNYLNLKSFLYLVTKNAGLDYLKQKQRKLTRFQEFLLSADLIEHSDDYLSMEAEILKRIYKEIERLPGKCKEVFELSFLQEKSVTEIAAILNISASNVSSQKSRAIQLLRIALADSPLSLMYVLVSLLHK